MEQLLHLSSGGVCVLRAAAGEVGGLIGSDGGVGGVVLVGGQRVALFWLQHLRGCGDRLVNQHCSWAGFNKVSWLRPSDSATMTVKNLTAPFMSLNQEQLNRNRMEDDVTLDDLSLTWTLGTGTGGPTARTVKDRQLSINTRAFKVHSIHLIKR